MQGLMMDYPLTLTRFFERARRLFPTKRLATRIPGAPLFEYTYALFAERVERLAGGWHPSASAAGTASGPWPGIPIGISSSTGRSPSPAPCSTP
jgi:hypothetical protein